MGSEIEAQENFYKGLGAALADGKEISEPIDMDEILKAHEMMNRPTTFDPLSVINSWSVTGQSQEMRMRMQADTWVIKDMAIRGQYTAIYAPPNTGKTLLALWGSIQQVKSGAINGKDIYYVNADDHGKGAVDKVEICEQYGINMLIPNWNGFETKQLRPMLRALIDEDRAKGVVIILDTLKKFTVDLMDKKSSSDFGNLAREFATAGGSPIVLAHTNKNKGRDGKSIAGGTSDIGDDADCVFVLDALNPNNGSVHTIEARNTKNRGDVPQKVSYQFTRERDQSYWELLDSVKRLDKDAAETAQEKAEVETRLVRDADPIRMIQKHITQNNQLDVPRTKTELIKHIAKEAKLGEHKVRSIVNYFEGDDYEAGYRWTCDKVGNERPVYKLLDPPLKT